MKWFPSLILVVVIGFAFSCKKASGPADVKSAEQNNIDSLLVMKALVNGAEWYTDSAYSYKVKKSDNDTDAFNLKIVATQIVDSNVTTIAFDIANFRGIGEYPVNPPWNTAIFYKGNERHFASSGIFIVSSDTSSVLSGQFNFVADTINVANGTFSVALP